MLRDTRYREFTIPYRVEGDGPPVLLLHGFCESMEIWDEFVEALSTRYRVITPDLVGQGNSTSPGSEEYVVTMEMLAEGVNEVLNDLEVERCTLVGHSMGGYTSLAFAELFPHRVRGLCLFHSTAMADTEERKRDREKAIEAIREDRAGFLECLISRMFAPTNLDRFREEREKVFTIAMNTSSNGLIGALRGMRDRKDRQSILEDAPYPVLFIVGKDDQLIPLDRMLPQFVKPAHCEVLMLSGVGHMGFFEAKEKTLFAIRKFLEETL